MLIHNEWIQIRSIHIRFNTCGRQGVEYFPFPFLILLFIVISTLTKLRWLIVVCLSQWSFRWWWDFRRWNQGYRWLLVVLIMIIINDDEVRFILFVNDDPGIAHLFRWWFEQGIASSHIESVRLKRTEKESERERDREQKSSRIWKGRETIY